MNWREFGEIIGSPLGILAVLMVVSEVAVFVAWWASIQ